MFNAFISTLSPILTMFTCIIIGYILNKSEKVPESTATVLSKCESYFILPALSLSIIDCLMNMPLLFWASKTTGNDKKVIIKLR